MLLGELWGHGEGHHGGRGGLLRCGGLGEGELAAVHAVLWGWAALGAAKLWGRLKVLGRGESRPCLA